MPQPRHYLYFLNRFLIQLHDARHKSLLIRFGGLLSLTLGGTLGYLAYGTPWLAMPVGVLAVTALGESRRLIIRRRCAGSPSVEVENVGVSWRKPNTTTDLAIHRYTIAAPGWRGPTLRIAHVSDLHVNSHLPVNYFAAALRRAAAAEPDLLFFTGDFITDPKFVTLLPELLPLAHGRLGTFGVLGNHDYWADPAAVDEAVRSAGVTLLRDRSLRVPIGDGCQVLISGCEAPWSSPAPPIVAPPTPVSWRCC